MLSDTEEDPTETESSTDSDDSKASDDSHRRRHHKHMRDLSRGIPIPKFDGTVRDYRSHRRKVKSYKKLVGDYGTGLVLRMRLSGEAEEEVEFLS